ncbi:MAG: GNAT family N-acetyltransferase, partial [Actinomycetota bacterium]
VIVLTRPAPGPPPEPGPSPQAPPAGPGGGQLHEASPADGPRYARAVGTDTPATFAERLGRGQRCFFVLTHDRLVHATWVATGATWMGEVARWFTPPPGDAYVFESFTAPSARGRGIYPFALAGIGRTLGAEGAETLWIATEATNAPSLRAIDKAGFTPRFELSFRRRLGTTAVSVPPAGHGVITRGRSGDP